jgi:hypothetical protein
MISKGQEDNFNSLKTAESDNHKKKRNNLKIHDGDVYVEGVASDYHNSPSNRSVKSLFDIE